MDKKTSNTENTNTENTNTPNMKILCIGDPHFKVDNLDVCDKFIDNLCELVNDITPDFVVLMGDILDTHEKLHALCLNKVYNMLVKLKEIMYNNRDNYIIKHNGKIVKNKIVLIVGNHDMISPDEFLNQNHWMNVLKQWEGIEIADTPITYNCVNKFDNNNHINLHYIPYVYPGKFSDALKVGNINPRNTENNPSKNIIFCHQEFYNCKFGACNSVIGDKYGEENCMVISGHIHDKDLLQKNIYYTGSAIQHGFSENVKKTLCLLQVGNNRKDENDEVLDYIKENKEYLIDYEYVNGIFRGSENTEKINICEIELNMPRKYNIYKTYEEFDEFNDKFLKLKKSEKNSKKNIEKKVYSFLFAKNKGFLSDFLSTNKIKVNLYSSVSEYKILKQSSLYKYLQKQGIIFSQKYNKKFVINTEVEKRENITDKSNNSNKSTTPGECYFLDILDRNINSKKDPVLYKQYKEIIYDNFDEEIVYIN